MARLWINGQFLVLIFVMLLNKRCAACFCRVWLRLLFKMFFIHKYIKIIFFYFLNIIFNISTSKWFENIKNILIWRKKNKNKNKNKIYFKIFLNTKTKSQPLFISFPCMGHTSFDLLQIRVLSWDSWRAQRQECTVGASCISLHFKPITTSKT
jgi:hypothetical protein